VCGMGSVAHAKESVVDATKQDPFSSKELMRKLKFKSTSSGS